MKWRTYVRISASGGILWSEVSFVRELFISEGVLNMVTLKSYHWPNSKANKSDQTYLKFISSKNDPLSREIIGLITGYVLKNKVYAPGPNFNGQFRTSP